ncbi:hypothetical protein CIK05_11185 [Bdellovibrio sp. qaytius]|nr:hypothetical protein CIK05_11185 [Bdellovibrio sp. qaytius]
MQKFSLKSISKSRVGKYNMELKKILNSDHAFSRIFAVLTIAIGSLSLLGWVFDLGYLKAVIPNLVTIKFNTALCIFLLGLVSYAYSSESPKQKRWFNLTLTAIVFVVSSMTIIEYLAGFNFGIDELVFKDIEVTYLKPGRMSFVSATVLALTSFSIFLSYKKLFHTIAGLIQVLCLFISVLALLGYLYGASNLLSFLSYKTIAPQTVVAFLCLNLSLLFSARDSVILQPFLAQQSGGLLSRKLLPISMFTLMLIGFCVREMTQYYKIDASIDGVIVVTLSLFLFSFFIWWNARRLNTMDLRLTEKRKSLEQLNTELEERVRIRTEELQKSELKFRETVELAADGIFEADLNGIYTSVNLSGCRMLQYDESELIGKTIMDIIFPEDTAKLKVVLKHHAASSDIIQLEWNLRRKDGTSLPVEISARSVKGNRIVAFVRDISLRKKSDLAIVSSEKKFRTVFEGAYDSILVADENGYITMINKKLGERFGYREEELIGKPIEVLIPERYRAFHVGRRMNYSAHAHSRPMGAGLDLFGLKKDGSEFPVDISLSPTFTDEGLRVTAIIRDVTERKKFEDQQKFLADMGRVLEEAFDYDEKFEKLAELLVTKYADSCVIKVVEQGELVYKASATKQKEKSEEFKNNVQKFLMPGSFGSLHVLRTGEAVIVEDTEKEITENSEVDQANKKALLQLGAFSYAVLPLISQGRAVGTIAFIKNSKNSKISKADADFFKIIASRCAVVLENARLQQYSRLAEVVTNSLPSLIAYWDKNEICQFANKSYIDWFGFSPENLVGTLMRDLLGDQLYQKNKAFIEGALNGQVQQFDRDLTMKSTGQLRHTKALYIPDFIQGKVAGFFVLVVDVTEIKEAELEALSQKDRAERAVKTREEVLAIVSHDLKNPLSAVSLSADFLDQSKALDWAIVRDCGVRIRRSVKQMQNLISDLLDFAKMESSSFAVELVDEDLKQIISQVVDSFKTLAQQKKITIRADMPSLVKNVACDGGRIVQVLSNLIGNSLKFSPIGSEIVVAMKDLEQNLLISVADNGPGISAEQLPKVFDRFWQSEKAKKLGSGLGLSIAQGIVVAHNGKIWVESEIGKGTTFYFTIPYSNTDQLLAKKKTPAQASSISHNTLFGAHILLVDDSEDNIVFVKMILERAGAEISVASSADEALKIIQKNQLDLIITDIEMPDGNGFQLLADVRKALGKNLPVISFSAHSAGLQYDKILRSGFDGNIFKPVKPDAMVGEISRVLSSHQSVI